MNERRQKMSNNGSKGMASHRESRRPSSMQLQQYLIRVLFYAVNSVMTSHEQMDGQTKHAHWSKEVT